MSLGSKSLFSPFRFLTNLFKKPTTIRYPKEDLDVFDKPGASPNYRGLHSNDIELCIGCGTCQEVCTTSAIEMVEGENAGDGKLGVRPKIDYGRCCYCGFCVDVCPTGSLNMSREFRHIYPTPVTLLGDKEVNRIKDEYFILPGDRYSDNKGYVTDDDKVWLDLKRIVMGELSARQRWNSFIEIVKGFSREEAVKEASRCIECGICKETCPAHMQIPEYINAIWSDNLNESVRQMYLDNPLPGICGRICTHKCETVCALGHRGDPIAIRWLKRYAIDSLSLKQIQDIASEQRKDEKKKKKISIIGSGPAGLSLAYYLGLMGYDIIIYEKSRQAGGVMRYGIPKYRLPDAAIDKDIEVIKSLGIQIKTGVEVGNDITFKKIQKSSDAVFISSGFSISRSTKIPGIDGSKCFRATDLLAKIAEKKRIYLGKKAVVIGGGNVAFDIARSIARLQREKWGKVDVSVACLESGEAILADDEEILEAKEEGIKFFPGRCPVLVSFDKKTKLKKLETVKCLSPFDEDGRFNPQLDKKDKADYQSDMIIEAVGQSPDYSYLGKDNQKSLEIIRGKILTDQNGGTSIPWLFAGGDIVHGPDVIHGVSDGHRSAKAIDKYLSKKRKK